MAPYDEDLDELENELDDYKEEDEEDDDYLLDGNAGADSELEDEEDELD